MRVAARRCCDQYALQPKMSSRMRSCKGTVEGQAPHRRCIGPTTWRLCCRSFQIMAEKRIPGTTSSRPRRPTSALSMVVPLEPCCLIEVRRAEVATFLSWHWCRASQFRSRLAQLCLIHELPACPEPVQPKPLEFGLVRPKRRKMRYA